MGLLELIKRNNGLLEKPGDSFVARVTQTNRVVAKASKDNGNIKYSETHYSNGTVVKTLTEKGKRK